MKILVALDETPHSAFVIQEVTRLASNTWADVTLLGVESGTSFGSKRFGTGDHPGAQHPLTVALRGYRERFQAYFPSDTSPYACKAYDFELIQVQSDVWEDLQVCRGAHKSLTARIRPGNPANAILTEASQSPCDLIVLGTGQSGRGDAARIAHKVAEEADTSVLAVMEAKQPRKIVCCLNHDHVSQPSLEMINQMVTLHQADLEIVGLTTSGGLRSEVESVIGETLKYYAARGIKALVQMVALTSLEAFAAQTARENLVAFWMGRQTLLPRFFSPFRMDRLLAATGSSVLVLR